MGYRKKPIVIKAVQYTGDNKIEILDFTNYTTSLNNLHKHLTISTLEGDMRADVGDWIIRGIQGEFYPCKPDIFEETYELVEKPKLNPQAGMRYGV